MEERQEDGRVLADVNEGVGRIRLNRPEAFNAIDLPLAHELRAAVDRFADDASVRAILIRGSGKHFCAGGDVKWFEELGERLSEGLDQLIGVLNPVLLRILELPVPVVTAVQGAAGGGGAGLAMAGDVVLAAESFRMVPSYSAIGLTPDLGAAYSLAHRIGPSRAKEFFFRNRPLDAARCLEWGVVNAVFPDDRLTSEAERLAAELACGPTQALAWTKRLVDGAWKRGLEEHLALEREFMSRCGRSRDGREGVRAFLEKREPRFAGHGTD